MKVCCVGAAGGVIERAVAVMVLIDERPLSQEVEGRWCGRVVDRGRVGLRRVPAGSRIVLFSHLLPVRAKSVTLFIDIPGPSVVLSDPLVFE